MLFAFIKDVFQRCVTILFSKLHSLLKINNTFDKEYTYSATTLVLQKQIQWGKYLKNLVQVFEAIS